MDDYVSNIKEEVKTEEEIVNVPLSNYRELLSKFIVTCPDIKVEAHLGGDVFFSVSIKDIGLTCQDVQKYKADIYSYPAANFMGELLVRENINVFAKILTKIDGDTYTNIVNGYEHKQFGLKVLRNRFHFCFHISLVQSILNEDFCKEIKNRLKEANG